MCVSQMGGSTTKRTFRKCLGWGHPITKTSWCGSHVPLGQRNGDRRGFKRKYVLVVGVGFFSKATTVPFFLNILGMMTQDKENLQEFEEHDCVCLWCLVLLMVPRVFQRTLLVGRSFFLVSVPRASRLMNACLQSLVFTSSMHILKL